MKTKKTILIMGVIVLLIGFVYFLTNDTNEGKTYASKENLCIQFAQSYLRTIPKHEPNLNDEKWQMAVDVETDLYNMCLLELNKEALKNYEPSAIQKYKDGQQN